MKIVTVLRSGGEYTPEHVKWIDAQISGKYEHVCLSDTTIPGIETIALQGKWKGWFAKLELFNPELIDGDIFYIDLDTIITGDINHMFESNSLASLTDFYFPQNTASGILRIPQDKKWGIWQRILELENNIEKEHVGDGEFLRTIDGFSRLQDLYPGEICSYKANIARKGMPGYTRQFSRGDGTLPEGTRIICFHGRPRPWKMPRAWLESLGVTYKMKA